ncbi:MAG: PLP-dependent transferase [Dermatophilaceae bacterium]
MSRSTANDPAAAPTVAPADTHGWAPATIAVAAGRPCRMPGAPVNPPVELSSTYAVAPDWPDRLGYGRADNATWEAFESALGALEGGDALVFASGMAAIAAALSTIPHHGVVVAPLAPYNTTAALLRESSEGPAARVSEVRWVDLTDVAATEAALDGADAVWLESPTNPLMDVADLPHLITSARQRDVTVFCDNTFATPLGQQPLAMGADVVVHSVTKYLAGHSDVVLGAVVTRTDGAGPDLHSRLRAHRTRHGSIAGPFEVWLALRGMRTLHVRVTQAVRNADVLAVLLADHPAVRRVRYPGAGAMLAIDVAGDAADADAVVAACRLWLGATSLGGVESLIERRRRYPGESELVPESLLRLSVGIEDVNDLWHDLSAALDTVAARHRATD